MALLSSYLLLLLLGHCTLVDSDGNNMFGKTPDTGPAKETNSQTQSNDNVAVMTLAYQWYSRTFWMGNPPVSFSRIVHPNIMIDNGFYYNRASFYFQKYVWVEKVLNPLNLRSWVFCDIIKSSMDYSTPPISATGYEDCIKNECSQYLYYMDNADLNTNLDTDLCSASQVCQTSIKNYKLTVDFETKPCENLNYHISFWPGIPNVRHPNGVGGTGESLRSYEAKLHVGFCPYGTVSVASTIDCGARQDVILETRKNLEWMGQRASCHGDDVASVIQTKNMFGFHENACAMLRDDTCYKTATWKKQIQDLEDKKFKDATLTDHNKTPKEQKEFIQDGHGSITDKIFFDIPDHVEVLIYSSDDQLNTCSQNTEPEIQRAMKTNGYNNYKNDFVMDSSWDKSWKFGLENGYTCLDTIKRDELQCQENTAVDQAWNLNMDHPLPCITNVDPTFARVFKSNDCTYTSYGVWMWEKCSAHSMPQLVGSSEVEWSCAKCYDINPSKPKRDAHEDACSACLDNHEFNRTSMRCMPIESVFLMFINGQPTLTGQFRVWQKDENGVSTGITKLVNRGKWVTGSFEEESCESVNLVNYNTKFVSRMGCGVSEHKKYNNIEVSNITILIGSDDEKWVLFWSLIHVKHDSRTMRWDDVDIDRTDETKKYQVESKGILQPCQECPRGQYNPACTANTALATQRASCTDCSTLSTSNCDQETDFLYHTKIKGCEDLEAQTNYECRKCPTYFCLDEDSNECNSNDETKRKDYFLLRGCSINFLVWHREISDDVDVITTHSCVLPTLANSLCGVFPSIVLGNEDVTGNQDHTTGRRREAAEAEFYEGHYSYCPPSYHITANMDPSAVFQFGAHCEQCQRSCKLEQQKHGTDYKKCTGHNKDDTQVHCIKSCDIGTYIVKQDTEELHCEKCISCAQQTLDDSKSAQIFSLSTFV